MCTHQCRLERGKQGEEEHFVVAENTTNKIGIPIKWRFIFVEWSYFPNSMPFSLAIRYFLPQKFIFTCVPWTTCQTLHITLNDFHVVRLCAVRAMVLDINFISKMSSVVHSPLLSFRTREKNDNRTKSWFIVYVLHKKKHQPKKWRNVLHGTSEYLYLFVSILSKFFYMTWNTSIWTISNHFNKCLHSI